MLLGKPGEYITFKQCQAEGCKVKKGEKTSMVVFWKWLEQEDEETGEKTEVPYPRYYNVFHICEIIDVISAKYLRLIFIGRVTLNCRNGKPDPMNEAFLQMAVVLSKLELATIRAWVHSGMENARAKGRFIGRPRATKNDIPVVFYKHYPASPQGT